MLNYFSNLNHIVQTLIGKETCGYIGTNGRSCAKFDKDTNNTTPDSDKLYEYFDEFVKAGCNCVAMEASSEAFFRKRLETITRISKYKIKVKNSRNFYSTSR